LQGGRDAVRKAAPLEVIGDLVLEPGGGVELPLGELLLQPIASDLAQRLHRRKGIDRIVSRIETENPPPGRSTGGESGGLGGGEPGTFREGEEELVMLRAGFFGKGIEFWRKTGGGDEGQGRGRGRERNRSAVRYSPFFYLFRFQTWMLPVFFFFFIVLFFSPIDERITA